MKRDPDKPRHRAGFIAGPLDRATGYLRTPALPALIECGGGTYRLYPDTGVYHWAPHPKGA